MKLQPVIVKSYESNAVVIAGGVNEGAKVVALGVQKIDPAQKVRVVSALSFSSVICLPVKEQRTRRSNPYFLPWLGGCRFARNDDGNANRFEVGE